MAVNFAEGGRSAEQGSTPPRSPKSLTRSMDLAQELVDYIIDLLQDDQITLLRVSLVSRAWVPRTRTYLCKSLNITRSKLSSLNPSHLTPLCKYVKALDLTWPTNTNPSAILDCFEGSRLHTLTIHSCKLYALRERTTRRCFAKFPSASITALKLYDISPTHETLLILLSLFPNVDDLTISVDEWKDGPRSDTDESEIIRRISPPRLRGSFKSFDPPSREFRGPRRGKILRGKLLRTIATLPLRFQTVSLSVSGQSQEEIGAFLNSCSKTVREVFVVLPHRESWPHIPPIIAYVQYANV